MESEPQKFGTEVVNSVREYLKRKGILDIVNEEVVTETQNATDFSQLQIKE